MPNRNGSYLTRRKFAVAAAAAVAVSGSRIASSSAADATSCVGKVPSIRVIAEALPTIDFLNAHKHEFEAQFKTSVQIDVFGENARRAKARLDASQGTASYQVYYIDEASIAEFASAGWVLPLLDHMPKDFDWPDFLAGRRAVATYNGTAFFAPFEGGGDLLMYRKDLLAAKGLSVPKNLDELKQVAAALNAPPDIYGWAARGERGSGMNVWRWTSFFRGLGGQWFDGTKPAFNSAAAVSATKYYLSMFKYAPPGSTTYTWSEVIEGFRGGRVAMILESDVFGPWAEDKLKSRVVGKVGYAPPPDPLPSAGFAHGFAVAAKGNPTDCSKAVAGAFIAWSTSKEMEARKVKAGILSDFARTSTLDNPDFQAQVNPDYIKALRETAPKTSLLIWKSPLWPEVGDDLGLTLEEVFTGSQPDIQQALDAAVQNASDVISQNASQ
jgi:multiple sugar transport system substrate-binding protein